MKRIILFLCVTSFALQGISQKSQIDLPINWNDTANVDYTTIDFGGDSSLISPGPITASNIVLKVIKTSGAQVWAGTVLGNDSLATAIPFAQGNTIIEVAVYSPDSGITVLLKVEDETNGAIAVETKAETTVANAWDTLSFDFANNVSGTPAINFTNTYDKIAIFFDFGTAGTGKTYYVDYVSSAMASGPSKASISLPITWDDTANVNYSVIDFGGDSSYLAADPNNASNIVLATKKPTGAQVWAGVTFGNSLDQAIPFSVGYTTVKAVVYSPDTGIVVKLKVEDTNDPTKSVETNVTTTVANAWDTLSFDFSNQAPGTAAINYSYTFNKMSIFYDFGTSGSGKTYYVDYVEYDGLPAKATIDLPITWDDTNNVDYSVVDFGGNSSKLAADPTNASNTVLESEKTNTAQVWAGTSLGNNLATAIPFSVGNTTITAVVYSPDTGIVVKLKVEDKTDGTISVETDVTTTVANAWDTLSFDFNNNSAGTAAIDFTKTYDKMSIFYNFGVAGATAGSKTYYVDQVSFGQLSTGLALVNNYDNANLMIYPNPAKEWITVAASNFESENLQADIINSVGQVIFSARINTGLNAKINISQLENGLYFMVVKSNSTQSTSKFFISK